MLRFLILKRNKNNNSSEIESLLQKYDEIDSKLRGLEIRVSLLQKYIDEINNKVDRINIIDPLKEKLRLVLSEISELERINKNMRHHELWKKINEEIERNLDELKRMVEKELINEIVNKLLGK